MNQDQKPELNFRPLNSGLKGVGGWLAFFIIGQAILRPLRTWAELNNNSKEVDFSLVEEMFPTAANLIKLEYVVTIGLLVFGIVVAITLWKVHTPSSVKLAKIYLITNPIFFILDPIVFKFSDLPPEIQDKIMQEGLINAGAVTFWCLIWFLYFVKSERVRATYYDGDIASMGLR
jgi:hypothetical protein